MNMGKPTLLKVAVMLLCSVGLVSEALALPDCSTVVTQLYPCVGFVGGSDPSPSQSCCTTVKSAVAATPVCLCELLGYGGNFTLPSPLNVTRATELPGLCNIAADPAMCQALVNGAPFSSPVPSEIPSVGAPTASSVPGSNSPSRKIPGTILSIVQLAAAPAVVSLLLRGLLRVY